MILVMRIGFAVLAESILGIGLGVILAHADPTATNKGFRFLDRRFTNEQEQVVEGHIGGAAVVVHRDLVTDDR